VTGPPPPSGAPPDLGHALAALRRGEVVAIPTDTVYGLAVDPDRAGSTGVLFALKARPPSLDLPVLVANEEQAGRLSEGGLPAPARRLAAAFWPGGLTIVVRRRAQLAWEIGPHADTIGLRVPDHVVARALCREVGPLATSSANLHGEEPCVDAASVAAVFGDRIVVVDGGRCDGVPSTVVAVVDDAPRCLREGAVPWADVVRVATG
jgi:L-threonylcarbamoyladenylate synthase